MFYKVFLLIQKIKWNYFGFINPKYFVWTFKGNITEENFDESGKDDYEKYIKRDKLLLEQLNPASAEVLEIGSGAGRITKYLAQAFKKVIASDISSVMLRLAKKRLSNALNVDYLTSNGEKYKLKDNSIDLVFSYIVFQHFPSKKLVINNLKEIHRILRPAGLAKIQFRGKPAFGGKLRYLKWYYGVNFKLEELRNILETINFEVQKIEGDDCRDLWATFKKDQRL